MKLILSSSDFGHPASRRVILDHLPKPIESCRLLFIPNEKATSDKITSGRYHARMTAHGFSPDRVSVWDLDHPHACLGTVPDVIYASGGNTFLTLARLRICGFDHVLCDLIRSGVTYVGGSAGAHMVCGDLAHVARYDDPPPGDPLCGLGLADLALICHFSPARQAVLEALRAAGRPVCPLTDADSLILDNGCMQFTT